MYCNKNLAIAQPKNPPLLPYLPSFWLLFHLHGAGVEWIDAGLPPPSYLEHLDNGYLLGYLVDGYFGTAAGREFLNDVIGRFLVTFREHRPQRLEYKPHVKPDVGHYYPKILKLREIARHLDSLPTRSDAPRRADSFEDYVFWAIKLYTEDQIRIFGEGIPVPYPIIEEWALTQFIDKERSTIRAKCRSIWNWYDERGWKLPKRRKWEMTRDERARYNSAQKAEKARRKVIGAITGMFRDEYRTKTGRWIISKLAKDLDLSRPTVRKYLKEWEQEAGQPREG